MAKIYFNDYPHKSMNIDFPPVATDIIFSVQFERRKNYNGEFGFDWMRDNYENICKNYEELKKEYVVDELVNREYFVPWISMFPNQKEVVLTLKPTIFGNGKPKKDDIVKLVSKSGIRFELYEEKKAKKESKKDLEIKVKDLIKNTENIDGKEKYLGIDIKVFCDNKLAEDTTIDVLDKNDIIIGKIIFVKNDTTYNLNVKVVKVVRKESRDRDLVGINEGLKQIDLNKYLNSNSLQQALIKTTISDSILELNGEKLVEEDKIEGSVFKEEVGQVSSMFLEEYIYEYEKNEKHIGVLLFATILQKPGAKGDGQLWISDARNCSIFYKGLYSPTTYAHEIAHVLGCMHTFDDFKEIIVEKRKKVDESVEEYQKGIKIREDAIVKYQKKIKKSNEGIKDMKAYPNDLTAIKNIKTHTKNIEIYKKQIISREKNILKAKQIIIRQEEIKIQYQQIGKSNQYVFLTKDSTKENFMDYTSPRSARKSFWKWQWKTMQEDIKLYYSK